MIRPRVPLVTADCPNSIPGYNSKPFSRCSTRAKVKTIRPPITYSGTRHTVNSRVNPTVFELQYKKPRLDRGFSFFTLYLSYLNVSLYQNVGGLLIES